MAFKVNNIDASPEKAGSSEGNLTKTHSIGDLLHEIDNPNSDQSTNTLDEFGFSVDISGNRAIVGAYNEDVSFSSSGSAYIFDVNTGALLHTLDNPNADQGTDFDFFGYAVAIDGNRAIVSAYYEDLPYGDSGSVYIFDVESGALLNRIDNPNNDQSVAVGDWFGRAVAIDGNRAIVGANGEQSDSGTAYIFDVNTGTLLHTLDNPRSSSSDDFGGSVAISGNRAIVGASREDVPYSASGSAYIFDVNTGALLHTIDNPNSDQSTNTSDFFGVSVAISGNRAIVGASGEDVSNDRSGSAYIINVDTGAVLHTIDNPRSTAIDFFGRSVAISGNLAFVGTPREDIPSTDSGCVYMFDVSSGDLLYTFDNSSATNKSAGDQLGTSVAISGNRVIIGAPKVDSPYTGSGGAYIFAANDTYKVSDAESFGGFRQESRLLTKLYNGGEVIHIIDNPSPSNSAASDFFGYSVAISGNRAIAGAYNEDVPYSGSGSAYIFDVNTGALLHTINNPNSDQTTTLNDRFGWSVAISGNRAIVGASQEDVPYSSSGSAYIFDVNTGALLHTLDNPNSDQSTNPDDFFGYSVAISGNRAIVGAYAEDVPYDQSGSAYIFDVTTGSLLHTIDNPNTDNGTDTDDAFGISVAIDGNRAIVGAYQENVSFSSSGSAYIFDVSTGALLNTINNPNATGSGTADNFGRSVSISGNRAIVGAPNEDTPYSSSGSAYIINVDTGAVLYTINNPNSDQSTGTNDQFGWSVEISGNRAIVGTPNEDLPYSDNGSSYIINVDTGAVLHTINNPNSDQSATAGDLFGRAVAISGNRAIVGAYGEDVPSSTSGSAYILAVNDCNALDLLYDGARYGV